MTTIDQALTQVIHNLEALKAQWQRRMAGQRLAQSALAALRHIPGPPVYKLRWASPKQRAAFFASDGFGRGIPAKRGSPPAVTQGWSAEFIPTGDGGLVALDNSEPHWVYVQGWRVQPFHLDTGWVQLDDVADDYFRETEEAALEMWLVADLLEGV